LIPDPEGRMSHPDVFYPPARYQGDGGLINATFRAADQVPEVTYPSGGSASFLATHASTNGQFGLFRWDMAARAGGPGPHFHRTISESFFILAGTVRIYDGRDWRDCRPGDFLFVPEGGIHAFRNEDGPASMLILFAPGATREAYFETTARIADGLAMTDEERVAFYLRHDNHWV
jgi:mannose-6-phosphate isomerase-like protein (cupin superfamily)